jgi:protocatechuate 3,4-dioxygenase alpha subunit
MKRRLVPPPTPSQTIGPFFPPHLIPPGANDLTSRAPGAPPAAGEVVLLSGRIIGEGGKPAVNALIEIWQADAGGRFNHPADRRNTPIDRDFAFWGRARTDGEGGYRFRTIKPGSVDGVSAPHISVTILGSGLMRRLVTRMYFPAEALNESDLLLCSLDEARRYRLIARRKSPLPRGGEREELALIFDIVLRGEGETPFLDD